MTDFIVSFASCLIFFLFVWRETVNDIARIEILSPVVAEVPLSNRQF